MSSNWVELYLASKLTKNVLSNIVQFTKYINASIALRYGTYGPNNYSFSFLGWWTGLCSLQVNE